MIGLIALTSLVPLLFVRFPAYPTYQSVTLYVSAIAGYAGVVMLTWLYLLATRNLTKRVFRDQAALLKIHNWIGKYGTALIFIHPIFVVMSYGESLLYTVVPQIGTQFDNRVTLGRFALYALIIIYVSSALLRDKIAYRPWKYIHYLAYMMLPFAILHIPDVGSTFITSVAAKGFVVLVGLTFFTSSLFRLYAMLNLDRLEYVVQSNVQIAPNTYQLTLMPQSRFITPAHGQFVFIKLGLISEDHPFSVVYARESDGMLVLAYKHYQMFTGEMKKLQPGSWVTIDGPYGTFTQEMRDPAPTVFVAGGIGITPFVQHLLNDADQEKWLFYSNPAPENAAYMEPIRESLGSRAIGLYRTLPANTPHSEQAYMEPQTFQRYLPDPTAYRYFLCGPPDMVKTATTSLRSLGVPPEAIHTESFSF